jgi:hypothetical protein
MQESCLCQSVSELVVHLPPSERSINRYFGNIDSSIISDITVSFNNLVQLIVRMKNSELLQLVTRLPLSLVRLFRESSAGP